MRIRFVSVVALIAFIAAASASIAAAPKSDKSNGDGPQLAHMVFFTLKEDTPENRKKLVADCHKYLDGHKGTVYFSVAVIAKDLERDVNDREFDVALHMVFKNKAAHDAYQVHPRHLELIKRNKPLLAKVRVFDSYLMPVEKKGTEAESRE